jgi:hypothetical protein
VNDDDLLRRALREPTEPISSYRVLQDLRPTMRRARNRRRAGVGAAAAILLAGAGAGALALTTSSTAPTVRTTPASDENGAVATTLPTVPEPNEDSGGDTVDAVVEPTTAAPLIPGAAPTASEPEDDEQPEAPSTPPTTRSPAGVPAAAPTTPPTTEAPLAPPPITVAPTLQTLTSTCGEIVVTIDGRTVRITSITPLPGYTSQVATDGPESVEMTFRGQDRTCEIHAELTAGGLDVEVQSSGDD